MCAATIDDFRFTFTANVYKAKKPVQKKGIDEILKAASLKKQGNRVVIAEREENELDGTKFFFSCWYFRYEAAPPFLPESTIRNTLHGFIALIEIDSYLFLFKDSISNVSKSVDKYYDKLGFVELCSIHNDSSEAYESITTSPLSLSSTALRSRKLEAADLAQSMPMLSTSRQIPRNVKKRTADAALSVTPGSSRVSSTRKRAEFDDLVLWAIGVVRELTARQKLDSFMSSFAEPVSYASKHDQLVPTGVYLRLSDLEDRLDEWTLYWETKKRKDKDPKRFELKKWHLNRLFREAKETFVVEDDGTNRLAKNNNGTVLFNVNMNKKSITVTGKALKHIICVADGFEENLAKHIRRRHLLQVSFTEHSLQYCNGSLFKDDNIVTDVDGFLRSFKTFDELESTSSEKGLDKLSDDSVDFPDGSLFRFVEDEFGKVNDYIICDDLGTEWADHIGISTGHGGNPEISFYVSKHKDKGGRGASQFHDVVGQALKNIGVINISVKEFEERAAGKWAKAYNADKKRTKISRLRKGDEKTLLKDLSRVLSYPNTVRNMVLVVDFLSKTELQKTLDEINNKKQVGAYYTQLFWILASFMSTCREMSVSPIVVCKP
ncbi:MAG: hypothetical protein PHX58_02450 [Desulfovibrio sp.]|nr:hypothetical protein [Desulfovibrio sp.]